MEPSQVFIQGSIKNELLFMENVNNTSQLNIQEKLMKTQKECDDLREELIRSKEKEKISSEREKRAEERYTKFFDEQLKITSQKDETITKLQDNLSFKALEIEAIRQKNLQAVEGLRERVVFLEVEKLKSDQEFEEMKEKKMEGEREMYRLLRKKVDALRTIREFKDLVEAVDEVFEERNKIWDVFKDKVLGESVEEVTDMVSLISKDYGDLLPMPTGIHVGGGKVDGRPGQAVLQRPDCSPQVEANCTDLEKGTERQTVVESPVQVADRDDAEVPGELEYNSDSPANLVEKGKTNKLPSADGSPGQAVLQSPNCSPRVEANCTDLEKGTERSPASKNCPKFWSDN